jgi:hypothetical protein
MMASLSQSEIGVNETNPDVNIGGEVYVKRKKAGRQ